MSEKTLVHFSISGELITARLRALFQDRAIAKPLKAWQVMFCEPLPLDVLVKICRGQGR